MPETPSSISRHGPLPSEEADSRNIPFFKQSHCYRTPLPPHDDYSFISVPYQAIYFWIFNFWFVLQPSSNKTEYYFLFILLLIFMHQRSIILYMYSAPNVSKSLIVQTVLSVVSSCFENSGTFQDTNLRPIDQHLTRILSHVVGHMGMFKKMAYFYRGMKHPMTFYL